ILLQQIKGALDVARLNSHEWEKLVVAYEPRWAIGTGISASSEDVERAVHLIRDILAQQATTSGHRDLSNNVRIVYGGSVSGKNANTLAAIRGLDGFLVGKASMDPEEYLLIAHELSQARY